MAGSLRDSSRRTRASYEQRRAEPNGDRDLTVRIPAERAITFVRNLTLTISVLRAQWSQDPYVAAARALRALPRAVRRTSTKVPGALGELARGTEGAAVERPPASVREARRDARVALALNDPSSARRAWDAHPANDASTEARLLAAEGSLSEAIERLSPVPGRRARRLRDLLDGERGLLAPVDDHVYGRPPSEVDAARGGPVVHVVTNALPEVQAGYTVRTQGIARAQVMGGSDVVVRPRRGFPVTVGAPRARDVVVIDGVRCVRDLPWWLPGRPDARIEQEVVALTEFVRRVRPRVLHAHSNYVNARVALRVRAATGVPVVYEVRGFLEETWRSRGGDASSERFLLARESETQAMRAADHVVTISEGMAADIRARGVECVTVVPNSVDDSFLDPVPAAHDVRQALKIPHEAVVVGIVTTLNAYEGVDVLVDAMGRLEGVHSPVHLVVVGDGPERARIAALGSEVLGDRAHVVGRVPYSQVRRWFAAIDVFAVPRLELPVTSRVTPIKPLEAMATGRPVVASDLPPLREIVSEGSTGWFVSPGDADDLARVLRDVVRDPSARRAAGERAREWVVRSRTWSHAAEVYEKVYSDVSRASR